MRRALALSLALASLLAGCAKPERAQGPAVELATIEGVVTDPTLAPIRGATVTVDRSNATATTDATGAFRLSVAPGEWVVFASAPEHVGAALRARADAGAAVKLAFALPLKPTQAAHVEVVELKGLLTCGLATRSGDESTPAACGKADPNERTELRTNAPSGAGVAGVVVELVWTPTSPTSNRLFLAIAAVSGGESTPLGEDSGDQRVAIVVPASTLDALLASASGAPTELRFEVAPAGSFTDEEAAVDAGAAFQQPFTIYASFFYNVPPAAGYTAVRSASS